MSLADPRFSSGGLGGEAPTFRDPYFLPKFLKNCSKLKKFGWLVLVGHPPPLGSATAIYIDKKFWKSNTYFTQHFMKRICVFTKYFPDDIF